MGASGDGTGMWYIPDSVWDIAGSEMLVDADPMGTSSAELRRLEGRYRDRASFAGREIGRLSGVGELYGESNRGPFIDVIAGSIGEIGRALGVVFGACGEVGEVLEVAAGDVEELESRALILQRRVEALRAGDVEPSMSEVWAVQSEFSAIGANERVVLHRLAQGIEGVGLGPVPAVVDDVMSALSASSPGGSDWLSGIAGSGERGEEFRLLVMAGALDVAVNGDPDFVAGLLATLAADPDATARTVLDDVAAAMAAGETEGLDIRLFPPAYQDLIGSQRQYSDELYQRRVPRQPPPVLTDAEAEALALNLAARNEARSALGLWPEPERSVSAFIDEAEVKSFAVIGHLLLEHSGHQGWAGEWLAGQLLDRGLTTSMGWEPSDLDLAPVAGDLATNEGFALAFHNSLGAGGTAALTGLYNPDQPEAMTYLGESLALAAGTGRLAFDGRELVQATAPGFGPSPALLLLVTDHTPDQFLQEAAIGTIELRGTWIGGVPPMGSEQGEGASFYRNDDVVLLLLEELADRDLGLVLDVFQSFSEPDLILGPNQSGLSLGTPPVRWGEGTDNRFYQILVDVADPKKTGDEGRSTEAALWLLNSVGDETKGLSLPVALAVEQVLVDRPVAMVQSGKYDDHLEDARLEPSDYEDYRRELDPVTIDTVLINVFSSGAGDKLLDLRDALIPAAVIAAVEAGYGPDDLPSPNWLGEIDGRIDNAATVVGLKRAHDRDARNQAIRSLLGTFLSAGGGAFAPVSGFGTEFATSAVLDQVADRGVNAAADEPGLLSIDHELTAYQQLLEEENGETLIWDYRIAATLTDLDFLMLDISRSGDKSRLVEFSRNELEAYVTDNPVWSRLVVVYPEERYRLEEPGEFGVRVSDSVTVQDWIGAFTAYASGNAAAES